MLVRPATPADAETMARCHWLSANAAYGRDDPYEARLERTRANVADDGLRLLLAEDGEDVVGVLILGDAELLALYVHPERWGSGVGRALLERAHAALAETCGEAELTCLAANPRARRFYERNGWRACEQVTETHFGGERVDVVKYRRRLG